MTTKLVEYELSINKDYEQARANLLSETRNLNSSSSERGSATIIPVVVHVVHRNTHSSVGSGTNISNAQIEDQIRILNEDYSKTNSEFPNPPRSTFKNIAGNANLQFCLASEDLKEIQLQELQEHQPLEQILMQMIVMMLTQ